MQAKPDAKRSSGTLIEFMGWEIPPHRVGTPLGYGAISGLPAFSPAIYPVTITISG
jgi:hypothetical protein